MGGGCGKARPSQVHVPGKKEPMPQLLAAAPRGKFQSALPPRGEGLRDFARIFFADERKIYVFAKGMPSMRPLQASIGPSSTHVGDLSDEVTARAEALFVESLTQNLTQASTMSVDSGTINAIKERATVALSVNIGLDFALRMKLMPTFLQPVFVLIVLGEPAQVRAATYGFVAESPRQVAGDRPETKRSPFCVRLLSPNLLESQESDKNWEVSYNVREMQISTILQAVEMDLPILRDAASSSRWDPLL
eukprot:TRINITY_DN160_c1_g1_i2.p1 TRINITY_DN160_c1_g1~~TRINITY_DN160_c1_g1_i2.p1  ORF type:complete len:249 (-),score=46.42 TRINITY_DN160_c1_g1_i2:171-917(-)